MKITYLLSVLFIILLTNCTKDDGFKFGESETDFDVDTVYKTNSEGLLYVELDASRSDFSLSVYADKIPEPENKIAFIR